MSVATQRGSEQSAIPARILIAGGNLLAGALANALESHGFATMHVVPREPEIERGIEWHPNLVILDVRSLDLTAGSGLIGQLHRLDLQVCVIDEADDVDRLNAWMAAGTSAFIDGGAPTPTSSFARSIGSSGAGPSNRRHKSHRSPWR